MTSNAEERIAELQGELARARVALRASQGREQALREALVPFAIAWPLHRAAVILDGRPRTPLDIERLEREALGSFYTFAIAGSRHLVWVTLTGQDLKDAYDAAAPTRERDR